MDLEDNVISLPYILDELIGKFSIMVAYWSSLKAGWWLEWIDKDAAVLPAYFWWESERFRVIEKRDSMILSSLVSSSLYPMLTPKIMAGGTHDADGAWFAACSIGPAVWEWNLSPIQVVCLLRLQQCYGGDSTTSVINKWSLDDDVNEEEAVANNEEFDHERRGWGRGDSQGQGGTHDADG